MCAYHQTNYILVIYHQVTSLYSLTIVNIVSKISMYILNSIKYAVTPVNIPLNQVGLDFINKIFPASLHISYVNVRNAKNLIHLQKSNVVFREQNKTNKKWSVNKRINNVNH